MLSLLQVSLTIFNTTMLNVTFMLFTANLLTPHIVSLHLHNLKTATNLLVNRSRRHLYAVSACVQSWVQFIICCLHFYNHTISHKMNVVALISYFVVLLITLYFSRCQKKNPLRRLWSNTKHTSISKKYCRLFAIAEVLRKNFTRVGAYLNMSTYSKPVKYMYIFINILNKILQTAVPKTGNYNQMGIKWKCSFATQFILSCINNFTLAELVNVNIASNSDWALLKLIHKVTIWSTLFILFIFKILFFNFFFQFL